MSIYIIKRPVINEKTEVMRSKNNEYTLEVDRSATKTQIKKVVETQFNVKVVEVRTMRKKSIFKKKGATMYKTPIIKKAVVKLAEGSAIKYYENV